MLKSPFFAAVAAVLITLAGSPFGLGEAQAKAIYTGTFDPRGDVYGFEGTYKFAVDPACLADNGWKTVNGAGDCGSVVLVGGSLTLRKYAAPGTDEDAPRFPGVPDVTFNFSQAQDDWEPGLVWGPGPNDIGGMQDYIDSIYVVGNQLFGVDTPRLFGAFGTFDGLYWGLEFTSGGLDDVDRSVKLLVNCRAPFTEFDAVCDGPIGANADDFIIPASTNVTITRVPEPGSIALVGLGLAAAGALSRRRLRAG